MNENKIYAFHDTLEEAIETYGETAQLLMVIEEMSELSKEICKKTRGRDNRKEIIDELADVYVMLEQLCIMCNISNSEILERVCFKVNRLKNRIRVHKRSESDPLCP